MTKITKYDGSIEFVSRGQGLSPVTYQLKGCVRKANEGKDKIAFDFRAIPSNSPWDYFAEIDMRARAGKFSYEYREFTGARESRTKHGKILDVVAEPMPKSPKEIVAIALWVEEGSEWDINMVLVEKETFEEEGDV